MTPSICHTLNTTKRDQLEQVLVSDVAIELAKDPSKAKSLAEGIKSFLDALRPQPVLYNPHTGAARDPRDVASDPQAILCVKPGEPLKAAAITAPELSASAKVDRYIEAVKASGQYAAQLEAGAMSELHVSASVRPADIEASIEVETYFTAANGAIDAGEPYHDALELLTFCVLVLRNGTKVVGINHGAIDPAQHSAERGRQKARTQAVDKLWELEGYVLHSKLAVQR